MSSLNLNNKVLDVWNKADDCNCNTDDCSENHKLCALNLRGDNNWPNCKRTVIFGAHISKQPKSKYAWDIDHIIPLNQGGSNDLSNLQLSCVKCNRQKADN